MYKIKNEELKLLILTISGLSIFSKHDTKEENEESLMLINEIIEYILHYKFNCNSNLLIMSYVGLTHEEKIEDIKTALDNLTNINNQKEINK